MFGFDDERYERLRRFFLVSNIIIVALITLSSLVLGFMEIEKSEGWSHYYIIGLALALPGWIFLILYGFGCYNTKDWRRAVSAILAAAQLIVFLTLLGIFLFRLSTS